LLSPAIAAKKYSWPSTNKTGRGASFIPGSDKIYFWGQQRIRIGGIDSCIVYKKV